MRQRLITIILCIIWLSCKKTDIIHEKHTDIVPVELNSKKHDVTYSTGSDSVNVTIFDSCTNENIHIFGVETFNITMYNDTLGTYIKYVIDWSNIQGIGDSTGIIYDGGGRVMSKTKTNGDASNILATTKERIVFKSSTGKIVFKETAKFIQIDNQIIINFDTGLIESCKLN